jgi:hypothetical protein
MMLARDFLKTTMGFLQFTKAWNKLGCLCASDTPASVHSSILKNLLLKTGNLTEYKSHGVDVSRASIQDSVTALSLFPATIVRGLGP